MTRTCRFSVTWVVACLLLWTPSLPVAAANDATAATVTVGGDVILFRLFLKDGSTVASYGEFVRVGDDVVVTMPLGSDPTRPQLQLITVPAETVDWPRTDRYSASVRHHHYAATRGEDDFAVLSAEVAAVLNEIGFTSDRTKALQIADDARRMLAAWPAAHYGYRAEDVRDIIALIDEAAANIGGGAAGLQLSLVALPVPIEVEPALAMPTPREQVRRLVTLADGAGPTERVALLRAALGVMGDPASGIADEESAALRTALETLIRREQDIDASYARVSERLVSRAQQAAARARVSDVERVIDAVTAEDEKLGRLRPQTVRALRAELDARLEAARDLRLRRDQWTTRRTVYRQYVERIGVQVSQLVKARSALDAIRRLSGPSPSRLRSLQRTLAGGVERLQDILPPEGLRASHDLLLAAWRFAQSAVDVRQQAIVSADLPTAWQASSAAAGSLMLLDRAQGEMRAALAPPTLK
jgi:hypothetical protein